MDRDLLRKRIEIFVENNREEILKNLARIISAPSVKGEAADRAPFGSDVRQALDIALEIGHDFGLETADGEGYMGWAQLNGESEKIIGLAAHLDVVPPGDGWDFNPFSLARRDGFLIGRGVIDDKGPALLMLYVAKFYREFCVETGEKLPYTLRVLLGCNEETGMKCVKYYTQHYPMPVFCFTPDATFPVNYGEKGGMRAALVSGKISRGRLLEFSGGQATNAVASSASALVYGNKEEYPLQEHILIQQREDGTVCLTAEGKASHACEPEGSINAIALLVNYLLDNNIYNEEEKPFLEMQSRLLSGTDGSSIGIAAEDEYFTPLTCIGGVVELKDGHIRQSVDVRFPTTQTADYIERVLSDMVEKTGGTYEKGYVRHPFLINPDSKPVQACVESYEEITGRKDKLLTTSGGTYAHNFECAICFGMEDPAPDYPSWVGGVHCANEGIPEEWLFQSLKIYLLAVARLMELDF